MADAFRGPGSNFPDGFNAVTIRGVPITQSHPGRVFWVSNATTIKIGQTPGGSNGNPGTYEAPFGTIDYAIGMCQAGRGDVIFVKPGHAETVTTTTIAMDVADIAIIGLGVGSLRPTLTFSVTTTGSVIQVSANNMSITNMLCVATGAAVTTVFNCATATTAKDFAVENCEFRDSSTSLGFTAIVKAADANSMDGLYFARNKVFGQKSGPTANTTAVVMAAAQDRMALMDNLLIHSITLAAPVLLQMGATNATNLEVGYNKAFRPTTDVSVGSLIGTSSTASSGYVYNNYSWHIDSAGNNGLLIPTGSKLGFQQNYCHITSAGVGDASGVLNPAAV